MLLSLVSGILTGLTFVYKDFCFLNLVTLIPFIISLKDGKKGFLKGLIYSASLNSVTMSFFFKMHPMEFMGLTGLKSLVTILLMYMGVLLVEGVVGGTVIYVYQKFINKIWLFPFFYTLYEIILGSGELGLTLSALYLPWYKNILFIQSASIFGSWFLTLLIVFVNLTLYKFFETKKLKFLSFAFLIIIVNFTYGILRTSYLKEEPFKYDVALIQGNFSSMEKWQPGSLKESFELYSNLTSDAKEKYDVDAVIWPETVINTEIYKGSYWYRRLSELAKEVDIDLFTGCFYSQGENYYNSLIAFDNSGKQYEDMYFKRHLIPLAENEYINTRLKEGKEPVVMDTKSGRVGGLICIDSAYPYLSYKTNKNNCDYFVVISNDSWFSDSFGVESHFAHSVFRALENNKYVLRAGNTGISAVITPKGEVKGKIEPMKKGYIVIKGGEVTNEE